MPLVPRLDCTIWFGLDGGLAATIYHWTTDLPIDSFSHLKAVSDHMDDTIPTLVKSVLSSEVTYEGTSWRWTSATTDYSFDDDTGAGAGTVTGTAMPSGVAAVLRRYGNGPSRKANGRNFWPGMVEAWTDQSYLTNTAIAAYEAVNNFFCNTQSAPGIELTPVNVSRSNATLYTVTESAVERILGGQRRRRPGF